MNRVVLQIPVSKTLRTKAEDTALDFGFSSLQEAVRVFLAKLAKRTIEVSFQETANLSPRAKLRYQKMDEEFSLGRRTYSVKTVEELKNKLSG